jgi:GxxExxY protein
MMNEALTKKIIAAAYKVHNALKSGFVEKVYENAMVIELTKSGLSVVQQHSIDVFYEGHIVGTFKADLWVEDEIIVEIKAVENLIKDHEVQLVNYLTATNVAVGLLINFGSSVTVKRKYRDYNPTD